MLKVAEQELTALAVLASEAIETLARAGRPLAD
jgi:hypothetical protein